VLYCLRLAGYFEDEIGAAQDFIYAQSNQASADPASSAAVQERFWIIPSKYFRSRFQADYRGKKEGACRPDAVVAQEEQEIICSRRYS